MSIDFAKQMLEEQAEMNAEIERLRAAIAPLAECHLPPAGYEHLGVTVHFETEQIIAAKEAVRAYIIKEPPAQQAHFQPLQR